MFPFLPSRPSDSLLYYSDPQNLAECPKLQRALTRSAEEATASYFSNHRDADTAHFLKARCEPLAHLWKESVPVDPAFVLRDDQFALNLRVEFGLSPVPEAALEVRCGMCRSFVLARDNTHFINCDGNASLRTRKHNACSAHIAQAMRDLHGAARLESRNLWNKQGVSIE